MKINCNILTWFSGSIHVLLSVCVLLLYISAVLAEDPGNQTDIDASAIPIQQLPEFSISNAGISRHTFPIGGYGGVAGRCFRYRFIG